ncbi:MAG: DinB family protein [Flavobacteriales bacterium]
MNVNELSEIKLILKRSPGVFEIMVKELPGHLVHSNEGVDTWSVFDIVGHMIHGEKTDWIPRAKIILEHGIQKPFEPFDRFAQFRDSKGKSLNDLLAEFKTWREKSLAELDSMKIDNDTLKLKGMHPALGEVNLGQLFSTWVVHDLNHIAQVSRVIAKQYKEKCGVWAAYLRILQS